MECMGQNQGRQEKHMLNIYVFVGTLPFYLSTDNLRMQQSQ